MFYPEEFKERVKAAHPNLPKLYEYMEQGERFMVRQFLEAGIERQRPGISYEQVLEATSLEELQSYVKNQQERVELLKLWKELNLKDLRSEVIRG